MNTTPPNGGTRILWWIITVLTGFCSALGGHHLGYTSNAERIGIVEHDIHTIRSDIQDIKYELRRGARHENRQ
jgi:hypothetical protein